MPSDTPLFCQKWLFFKIFRGRNRNLNVFFFAQKFKFIEVEILFLVSKNDVKIALLEVEIAI